MLPIDVPDTPWLREPAKLVGWVVAAVIAIAAGLVELANEVGVLLPAGWQDEVRVATGVVVTVGLVATRLQALLTRNGIGAPGKIFDGVYSPHTVMSAEVISPESHPANPTRETGEGGIALIVVAVIAFIVILIVIGRA